MTVKEFAPSDDRMLARFAAPILLLTASIFAICQRSALHVIFRASGRSNSFTEWLLIKMRSHICHVAVSRRVGSASLYFDRRKSARRLIPPATRLPNGSSTSALHRVGRRAASAARYRRRREALAGEAGPPPISRAA